MKLSFDINRQDYADFNKFHFIKTQLKRRIFFGVLTIVALQFFLNKERFDLTATIISSLVCAVVYCFLIYRSLSSTKNIPQDNGTVLGHRDMEFSDINITCKAEKTSTVSDWNAIKKLENGKNYFYLYVDTNMAYIIPKRVFATVNEQDNFEQFILSKVKR
ncbi:MAG: YcxB family protein [Bacteroidetes bacterium]|nr:YcxB family protein [Bacteroidota bacterium]